MEHLAPEDRAMMDAPSNEHLNAAQSWLLFRGA
jgi:hypothetical protein